MVSATMTSVLLQFRFPLEKAVAEHKFGSKTEASRIFSDYIGGLIFGGESMHGPAHMAGKPYDKSIGTHASVTSAQIINAAKAMNLINDPGVISNLEDALAQNFLGNERDSFASSVLAEVVELAYRFNTRNSARVTNAAMDLLLDPRSSRLYGREISGIVESVGAILKFANVHINPKDYTNKATRILIAYCQGAYTHHVDTMQLSMLKKMLGYKKDATLLNTSIIEKIMEPHLMALTDKLRLPSDGYGDVYKEDRKQIKDTLADVVKLLELTPEEAKTGMLAFLKDRIRNYGAADQYFSCTHCTEETLRESAVKTVLLVDELSAFGVTPSDISETVQNRISSLMGAKKPSYDERMQRAYWLSRVTKTSPANQDETKALLEWALIAGAAAEIDKYSSERQQTERAGHMVVIDLEKSLATLKQLAANYAKLGKDPAAEVSPAQINDALYEVAAQTVQTLPSENMHTLAYLIAKTLDLQATGPEIRASVETISYARAYKQALERSFRPIYGNDMDGLVPELEQKLSPSDVAGYRLLVFKEAVSCLIREATREDPIARGNWSGDDMIRALENYATKMQLPENEVTKQATLLSDHLYSTGNRYLSNLVCKSFRLVTPAQALDNTVRNSVAETLGTLK